MSTNDCKIRAGFFSPGWPLSYMPNGIVSYIENIISGFANEDLAIKIEPVVLTSKLAGQEVKDYLIDISRFAKNTPMYQQLIDKLLYKINIPITESVKYQRLMLPEAHTILQGMQHLRTPLDILEIEESFGVASLLIRKSKVPIVTRLHGPWFIIGSVMNFDKASNYNLRVLKEGEGIIQSHGITSPSLDVLEKTRAFYNIDLPNAKVIPNPVGEVSSENLWHYNVKDKPYILLVGRFDLTKGGDIALLAFRIIATKNKEVALCFVGPDRGIEIDGKLLNIYEYINKFIPEESIKNRIEFLGHRNPEQISALRKNALVTIVCSRYEVFSISLVEALAAGCPTVTMAVGGMKEIIINEFNGLLAEPESPDSMAENVLSLIDDPVKMLRISKNAIEDTKKRFSAKTVAAQTADFYKTVLAT